MLAVVARSDIVLSLNQWTELGGASSSALTIPYNSPIDLSKDTYGSVVWAPFTMETTKISYRTTLWKRGSWKPARGATCIVNARAASHSLRLKVLLPTFIKHMGMLSDRRLITQ